MGNLALSGPGSEQLSVLFERFAAARIDQRKEKRRKGNKKISLCKIKHLGLKGGIRVDVLAKLRR